MKKERLEDITSFVPSRVFKENQIKEQENDLSKEFMVKDLINTIKIWKAVAFISCVVIFVLLGVAIIVSASNSYDTALTDCVNGGNSEFHCRTSLAN